MNARPALFDRYLDLLGVHRREPGLDALREIVAAHLTRIPFENVSKLYHKKHRGLRSLPDLGLFLDGMERFHFGGTCYSTNYHLYQLLVELGYDIRLCGADMSSPDVHMVSMVSLENREFLVDVGNAAPFLDPLPRDLATDYVVEWGRDRYVLRPRDAAGCSRLEMFRDGALRHGYLAKPAPRRIADFEKVIADSYRDEATFMNALLLVRFYSDRSVAVHNFTVIESRRTVSTIRRLADLQDLARTVQDLFQIPVDLVLETVRDLGQLRDVWD